MEVDGGGWKYLPSKRSLRIINIPKQGKTTVVVTLTIYFGDSLKNTKTLPPLIDVFLLDANHASSLHLAL